jgi:hypothetical protein
MKRLLAGAVMGGSIVLSACGRSATGAPVAAASATVHPASALVVTRSLPPLDLTAAGLANVSELVTPLDVSATDGGRTITLIGAYADPARTVFIFREKPDIGLPMVDVNDDQGAINASSSSGAIHAPGFRGDYFVGLDAGPRAGADGLAHLTISIRGLRIWSPYGGNATGSWAFSAAVQVQPATALAAPSRFRLGGWTVQIETLEVTPAVIHLQAVVNGASPPDVIGPGVMASFLELLDAAGNQLKVVSSDAGITVPKQQVNPSNYHNARVSYEWARPGPGTYRLRFQGGGGTYELELDDLANRLNLHADSHS